MTRYLLDTNVISNIVKPEPSPALLDWMADRRDADLYISTFSLAEIRRGILQKPEGRKRRELEAWYAGDLGPRALFRTRILAFDEAAAEAWAQLMAEGHRRGSPRSAIDMIIGAIGQANACVVVTDNERHFEGAVDYFNPMRSSGG
jgi:predicted nucleic acid-binding protein